MNPVRIAVVGLGNFGHLHALTLAGLAEAKLVGLVDRSQEALSVARERLPDVRCWVDLQQAINECDAEAWVVASSTASHVTLTQSLLAAGRRVLLEKPLAENGAEAMQLAPLVADDSSNLMLGHVVLFSTEFRQLLEEVRCRGSISYIDAVRHRPLDTLQLYPGEDAFRLLMVHDLYCVLALVNRAEPTSLRAQAHRVEGGAWDLACAQLSWKDGPMASLTASFLTPPGMPAEGYDRWEVFGPRWAARLQLNPRPIELWDDCAQWPLGHDMRFGTADPCGMLAEELRCFCRVVRGSQAVPLGATYQDAVQVQRWLDLLIQSAAC